MKFLRNDPARKQRRRELRRNQTECGRRVAEETTIGTVSAMNRFCREDQR